MTLRARSRRVLVALIATLAITVATLTHAGPTDPADAVLTSFPVETETLSFRTFDGDGRRLADSAWLVAPGTGNCCENYLASTATGRLLDMGGDWLRYSDDAGETWTQVSTQTQLGIKPGSAGEGAVVAAPNGDVIAVTWFPYDGDRLLATRYDAATDTWAWKDVFLHTPFYDRPWISVVPGPITYRGVEVPYLVALRGAWPYKIPMLVSTNGLDYEPMDTFTEAALRGERIGWLDQVADPSIDFSQPLIAAETVPLAGGGALLEAPVVSPCLYEGRMLRSTPEGRWECFTIYDRQWPTPDHRVGSKGTVHRLELSRFEATYALSRDGARSWERLTLPIPQGLFIESTTPARGDYDFKVNDARGLAVLGVKLRDTSNKLQVAVFVLSTKLATPILKRLVLLGKGDVEFASALDVEEGRPRMDFMTVAILPDGRVAASFADSDHLRPAVAIEQR